MGRNACNASDRVDKLGVWDGPLAGLARYGGRDYWFEVEASNREDPPAKRRYLLYALTDGELAD
jgi:hypothetical protein